MIKPVRIHDGVADVIADRDVAAHFAVVGVHVMHREPHLLEAIVDEAVLAAGNREDAVAAVAEGILGDGDIGRIPERHAVAGLIEASALHAFDDVAQDARTRRAMDIDSEQVAFEAIVFDQRPLRGSSRGNTPESIVCRSWPDPRMVTPRIVTSGAVTVTTLPAPPPSSTAPGRPAQYNAPIDPDRAFVFARRKFDDVAILRAVQHSLQRLLRNSLQRLRTGEARAPAAKIAAGMMRKKQSTCRSCLKPSWARRTCGPSFPCAWHDRTMSNSTSRRRPYPPRTITEAVAIGATSILMP